MLKLAAMIIFSFFAVLTPVAAQEENDQNNLNENNTNILFPAVLQCDLNVENILEVVIGKYGEEPFAVGTIVLQNARTFKFYPATMYLTVNPESGSYSLIAVFEEDGVGCMVGAGNGFSPAFQRQDIDFIEKPKIHL